MSRSPSAGGFPAKRARLEPVRMGGFGVQVYEIRVSSSFRTYGHV